MRGGHPSEDHQHRGDDGDGDPEFDAEDQRAPKGNAETDQVAALHRGDVAHLGDIDEAGDRHDDDGAEGGVGQRRQQGREEGDGQQDEAGRDDRGERRAGAGRVVDSGAGEPTGDRIATEEAGCHVGGAEADEFLVGIDAVPMAAGVDLGDGDRLHEPDQGDDQGGDGQVADQRATHVGEPEGRKGVGDVADDAHTTGLEVEDLDHEDGRHHDHEGGGESWGEALESHERSKGSQPERQGRDVHAVERANDFGDGLVEVVLPWDRDAEQVLDLREADDDGGRRGEADEHRVRQEVDEESQATDTERDVGEADHQGEQRGRCQIPGGPLLHEGGERVGGEQRHDGDRPDRELPGGAEQGVDQDRHRRGVEPDLGGQAREQRVGHRLGHEHGGDREAGGEIRAQIGSVVAAAPRQHGQPPSCSRCR